MALEVGAGGGSIARWLCEDMYEGGRVVATDLDIGLLSDGAQSPRLEIRRHDIVSDDLETSAYDLVHARLLLEHIPERLTVLQKLAAALRPGGYLVVEDVDYAGAVPVSTYGKELHEHVQSVRLGEFAKSGIDHYLGRELPRLFREEGLEDVRHEGRVELIEGGSASARWLKLSLDFLRGRLVGPGMLTDDELDRMIALLDDTDFSAIGPMMFAVLGTQARVANWTVAPSPFPQLRLLQTEVAGAGRVRGVERPRAYQ